MTYDLNNSNPQIAAISDVRLLIKDKESIQFDDDDIKAFLRLSGGVGQPGVNLKAAAMAMVTIASDDARLQKRIKTLALETDGPSLAKELRENAKVWIGLANQEISTAKEEAAKQEARDAACGLFMAVPLS
jgi:hypothetical protein